MKKIKYLDELVKIYTECFARAKQTGDVELMTQTEFFFDAVMKSGLANTAKEWFELGASAQIVHDNGPKAMNLAFDLVKNKLVKNKSDLSKLL